MLPATEHFPPAVVRSITLDPRGGRIMQVETNLAGPLLWINPAPEENLGAGWGGWRNLGGDKLWPSPTSQWPAELGHGWPPDATVDPGHWVVTRLSPTVHILENSGARRGGMHLRRRVDTAPGNALLAIDQEIAVQRASEFPAQLWSVTQVPVPEYCLLERGDPVEPPWVPLTRNGQLPAGAEIRTLTRAVCAVTPFTPNGKLGTTGRWVAAVYPAYVLVQTVTAPTGASGLTLLDRSTVQVWSSPQYTEIETVSPGARLAAGSRLRNTVRWHLLHRLPHESPDALSERISQLLAAHPVAQ